MITLSIFIICMNDLFARANTSNDEGKNFAT